MKNAVLAGGAGGVFLIGIAVGLGLRSDPPPASSQPSAGSRQVADAGRTTAPARERPKLDEPAPVEEQAAPDGEEVAPKRRPVGPISPYKGPDAQVPPPPPPPSADALAEGERVKRELDARRGKRGGGRVTTLVYPQDPKEAKALESRRLARWERRLQYGMNIKIKGLRQKVGLSANQEGRLRDILQAELDERKRLVSLHMNKEISNTTFDEKVKQNRDQAKAKVKALLTDQQYAAYLKLKPREQVLRDDVK